MTKIKKVIIILLTVIFLVSLSEIIHAAPLPTGIAINEQIKECAGYWPGDEYVEYVLSEGWKAYISRDLYEECGAGCGAGCIKGKGDCTNKYQCEAFEIKQNGEVNSQYFPNCFENENVCQSSCKNTGFIKTEKSQCFFYNAKTCCEQLGYIYVPNKTWQKHTLRLNHSQVEEIVIMATGGVLLLIIIISLVLIIRRKRKNRIQNP